MTNTDEAFRRYCAEYGLCNRVVFDAAYRMGLQDNEELIRNLTLYAERYAETIENEQYRQGVLSIINRAKEVAKEVE